MSAFVITLRRRTLKGKRIICHISRVARFGKGSEFPHSETRDEFRHIFIY
jgi:hypothetical protein